MSHKPKPLVSRQLDRRTFLWGSGAALGAGTLLSACGSNEKSSESSGSGKKDLTPMKMTLAYVVSAQFAGYLVAKEKGYYEDEGIDLTIQPGGTDVNSLQLLVAGSTDIALQTYGNVLAVRDSGADVVNIGQQVERSNERLVYFADKPELADPKNWAGKTISIFDGWQPTFAATVGKVGLSLDDINVVKQTFDMTNFINENVDMADAMIFNEYAQAIAGSKGRELALFDYGEFGTSILEHCIAARPDWAADNRDLTVGFLKASMKGFMDCRDDPEGGVDAVMKSGPAMPVKYQTWQMNEINKSMWPSTVGLFKVGDDAIKQSQDILYEYKVLKAPASADSVYFSYRDEAAKAFDEAELKGNDFTPMDIDPYTYFAD